MTAPDPLTTSDRYLNFDRAEWAELRAATPLTLREPDLEQLRGINDRIDLDEVTAVYLPLTRLLNLYVAATQNLHKASAAFLGTLSPKVPYVIGVAGNKRRAPMQPSWAFPTLQFQWDDRANLGPTRLVTAPPRPMRTASRRSTRPRSAAPCPSRGGCCAPAINARSSTWMRRRWRRLQPRVRPPQLI